MTFCIGDIYMNNSYYINNVKYAGKLLPDYKVQIIGLSKVITIFITFKTYILNATTVTETVTVTVNCFGL